MIFAAKCLTGILYKKTFQQNFDDGQGRTYEERIKTPPLDGKNVLFGSNLQNIHVFSIKLPPFRQPDYFFFLFFSLLTLVYKSHRTQCLRIKMTTNSASSGAKQDRVPFRSNNSEDKHVPDVFPSKQNATRFVIKGHRETNKPTLSVSLSAPALPLDTKSTSQNMNFLLCSQRS